MLLDLWAGTLGFLLSPTCLLRRSLLLDILLRPTCRPRRFLPFALRSRGCSMHVLLVILPHDGIARLVAVTLAVKRLLLLHCSRVPVS